MPQAGPYGITQVDVPGAINAYQTMQQNRIQMLVLQKQMEKEERDAKTQTGIQAAVQRYAKSQSGDEGSDTPAAPDGASGVASAYGAPADPLVPLPDASATAPQAKPRKHDAGDREVLFSQLIAIDPKVASEYADAFSKMDKAALDQFTHRNTGIMQIMAGLGQLPVEQRPAALQQAAGELKELGYTPEQIAGFDPSDANLRSELVKHMDAQRIVQFTDDQADNSRADANEQSLEDYRSGELDNTRRGQDLAHHDRLRGQDATDKRGRRGQDLEHQDRKDRLAAKPPAKSKAASVGDGAIIVNPKTKQRMQLRDGKWVAM